MVLVPSKNSLERLDDFSTCVCRECCITAHKQAVHHTVCALAEKEHTEVTNNPCKSKRGLRSFVGSRVCHLLCIDVSFEQKHAV